MTTQSVTRDVFTGAAEPNGKYDLAELERYVRLPRMQAYFQSIADALVARLEDDFAVFPPKPGDGAAPVTNWLSRYESNFARHLSEILVSEVAVVSRVDDSTAEHARETARMLLADAGIQEALRQFAVGRLALRWCARSYPQAAVLGPASRQDGVWEVPVLRLDTKRRLGQIFMDNEGTVLEERSSTGRQIREEFARSA